LDTLHNLSASSAGDVRALDEEQVCVFCHAPHNGEASAALWNRSLPTSIQQVSEAEGGALPIDGASLQCMSCHDPSMELGALRSRATGVDFVARDHLPAASQELYGPGSHPVSVDFDRAQSRRASSRTQLIDPGGMGHDARLDPKGKVQCNSCHDPHADPFFDPGRVPHFWRDPTVSTTCERCHAAPVADRGHDASLLLLGCASCHVGHGAPGTAMLPVAGDEACLGCHGRPDERAALVESGLMARSAKPADLRAALDRPVRHAGGARAGRRARSALPATGAEELSCTDCHGIHDTQGHSVDDDPVPARGLSKHSEVSVRACIDCHGGRSSYGSFAADIERLYSGAATSSHPIHRLPTKGLPGLTARAAGEGLMSCASCHGNDDDEGARGPHGSNWSGLLRLPYRADEARNAGEQPYSLCYRCHDEFSLDDSSVGWPGHRLHVSVAEAGCSDCHDPHGSLRFVGLLNFGQDLRTSPVQPGADGGLGYLPDGDMGSCNLSCHGVEHQARSAFDTFREHDFERSR
jgi:predicted CXXCH cytochrome family protein